MTFESKGSQSRVVDDILARVSQLSAVDRKAFMHAIQQQQREEDLQWLHKVWGRVALDQKEIDALVDEVRTEMHATHAPKDRR